MNLFLPLPAPEPAFPSFLCFKDFLPHLLPHFPFSHSLCSP